MMTTGFWKQDMLALTMTDVCKALEVLIFQIKNIFAVPVKDFQGQA